MLPVARDFSKASSSTGQGPGPKLQASSSKRQALIRTQLNSSTKLTYTGEIKMLIKDAIKITDSFTKTSKMPGLSYSLPAWECQTGAKLRKVPTSPCFGCYALKGNYTRYPAIKAAQYRRLDAIKNPLWVEAMAAKIKNQKWFRWHDAGDVQSHEHMAKILEVVKLTPNTKHWMPTQERPYLPAPEAVPDNMVIRLSGSKVDGPAPKAWSHTSTVVTDGSPSCPAPTQGGKCMSAGLAGTKTFQIYHTVNTNGFF
jgi:hypothetical protein